MYLYIDMTKIECHHSHVFSKDILFFFPITIPSRCTRRCFVGSIGSHFTFGSLSSIYKGMNCPFMDECWKEKFISLSPLSLSFALSFLNVRVNPFYVGQVHAYLLKLLPLLLRCLVGARITSGIVIRILLVHMINEVRPHSFA